MAISIFLLISTPPFKTRLRDPLDYYFNRDKNVSISISSSFELNYSFIGVCEKIIIMFKIFSILFLWFSTVFCCNIETLLQGTFQRQFNQLNDRSLNSVHFEKVIVWSWKFHMSEREIK